MKRLFTFILSIGIATASFAQSNLKKDGETVIKAKGLGNHHTDLYTFTTKDKQAAITRINRNFDVKVATIKKEHISRAKKNVLIKKSEAERDQQLKAVNEKFNSKYNSAFTNTARFDKH